MIKRIAFKNERRAVFKWKEFCREVRGLPARCINSRCAVGCSNCGSLQPARKKHPQVSCFVGNQKAVLGIPEVSGRMELDQEDEQKESKRR
jgi:hypothetical protein